MDNSEIVKNIEPKEVFSYFSDICSMPHGSGNVEQVSDYCVEFAKKHGLKYRQDDSLNVIIWKDATPGYENCKTVIIQGHMDMVAVKDIDSDKDMSVDGLDLVVEGDYLKAHKTSLGGDDGIAVAYALAILADDSIAHPALECVFTVDEEVGMLGADALDTSDLKGKILLNIDSEDEGIFLAGCAGGATLQCELPINKAVVEGKKVQIVIDGLTGGHSGTEIICQRANANVVSGRVLSMLSNNVQTALMSINGGEMDNAITTRTDIELVIDKDDIEEFGHCMDEIAHVIKSEYIVTDPELNISYVIDKEVNEHECMSQSASMRLIMILVMNPDGVCKMSNDIEGLVQTSLNLGILKTEADRISMCYLVRSSVESEKKWIVDKITSFVEFLGGEVEVPGAYPAWEYKRESRLRDIMVEVYEKMYGSKPKVETIHAGVECGLIADKIEGLDGVSFGPDILDIHTTREKLDILSVKRTWELIIEVLAEMKKY